MNTLAYVHLIITVLHLHFKAQPPVTTCRDSPCFDGVVCTDADRGYRCGECPNGYYGDGIRCAKIPTCADGPCYQGRAWIRSFLMRGYS